jgi:hypothetical protein
MYIYYSEKKKTHHKSSQSWVPLTVLESLDLECTFLSFFFKWEYMTIHIAIHYPIILNEYSVKFLKFAMPVTLYNI